MSAACSGLIASRFQGGCHHSRYHVQIPQCPRRGVHVSLVEKPFLESPRWIPLSFYWPLSYSSLPKTKHWQQDWDFSVLAWMNQDLTLSLGRPGWTSQQNGGLLEGRQGVSAFICYKAHREIFLTEEKKEITPVQCNLSLLSNLLSRPHPKLFKITTLLQFLITN